MKKIGIVVAVILGIWILGSISQSVEHHNNPYGWSESIIKVVDTIKANGFKVVDVPPANTMHSNRIKLVVIYKEYPDLKFGIGIEYFEKGHCDIWLTEGDWWKTSKHKNEAKEVLSILEQIDM